MTVPELLSSLRSLDVKLWVDGEQLRVSTPRGILTPELHQMIAEQKAQIIDFLQSAQPTTQRSIRPVSRDQDLPLSSAQQRMWFLQQLNPTSSAYTFVHAKRIAAYIDDQVLEKCLNEVVGRHEILRTTFKVVKGSLVQVISPLQPFHLPVIDLQSLPSGEREVEIERRVAEESAQPFDLSKGPLIRASLLRAGPNDSVFLLMMHHIISDLISFQIVTKEILVLYQAFLEGQRSPLPEMPIQYADFAVWQQEMLKDELMQKQLTYWKDRLSGSLPTIELPTHGHSTKGGRQSLRLSRELSNALVTLAQQQKATLFMVMLAAFKILLHRFSGQDDIIVGSPVAGRDRPELEQLVGRFTNTVALRTDLSGNPPFLVLLRRVEDSALGAYSNQDVPFERVVEALRPNRSLHRNPLFDVLVSFLPQNPAMQDAAGLVSDLTGVTEQESSLPITLYIEPNTEWIDLGVVFQQRLFSAELIHSLLDQFVYLLQQIIANPEEQIENYCLVTPVVQDRLPDPEIALRQQTCLVASTVPAQNNNFMADGFANQLSAARLPSTRGILDPLPVGNENRRSPFLPAQSRPPNQDEPVATPSDGVEARLRNIWKRLLKVEKIGVKDDFFALGGHSMMAVRMFAQIQEVFGVNLPLTSLFKEATIQHLANLIRELIGATPWSSLVEIQPNGSKPPFFCVHGLTGDVYWFGDLVQYIDPDQPFWGVQSIGLDGIQEPLITIEEMAAHYISEIRSLQPEGPYYIGGYSFGGSVAYEMARQLALQGQETALLVIIDHATPKSGYYTVKLSPGFLINVMHNLPYRVTDFLRQRPDQILARFMRQGRLFRKMLIAISRPNRADAHKTSASDLIDQAPGLPLHFQRVIETNYYAIRKYTPEVYSGCLTLLRGRGGRLLCNHDPEMGWGHLAKRVEVQVIPGSHLQLFRKPHIRFLAQQLQSCLDSVQSNHRQE